jgi:hypothetical protein
MKTTKRKLQVALTIISLTFLVFLAVGSTAAGRRPPLSKKEVKALIASAKTKEDQLKLADFCKAETVRLEAEAKDHDEMAEMYRKNPTPMAVKHPEAIGEGHCHEMRGGIARPLPRRRSWRRCTSNWRQPLSRSSRDEEIQGQ